MVRIGRTFWAMMAAEVGRDHRSDQTAECYSVRRADRRPHAGADPLAIAAPRKPLCDARAVVERPHPFRRRATLRSNRGFVMAAPCRKVDGPLLKARHLIRRHSGRALRS